MEHSADGHGVEDACKEIGRLYDAGRREELLAIVRALLGAALGNADKLAARVAELQRTLYGRKGERLSPNQLAWVFAVQAKEEQHQDTRDIEEPDEHMSQPSPRRGRRQGGRGQGSLPAHLPREEIRLAPTAEQLTAAGGTMRKWREERSMVLEYVPAYFKVLVYVREVWSNELGDVVTGPAPVKVLDKGLPGLELLVQVVLAKFRDHVPLARQTRIYQRLGVELSRNTLVDWVGGAAQLLRLLAYLIYRQVLGSHVVQADDTKLPVQDRRKAKNIKRGRLWALVGDHFYVAYRYAPDWRATTTFELLGERTGWLQVDAYKGYEPIFVIGKAIEVGCNMHCRRYFVRAFEAKDLRAARPLQLYQQLYSIEAASREAGEGSDARLRRRQRDSKPIFDELYAWLQQHAGAVRPSSLLGKAITYANNHWTALCRPLEDGRLKLDNGDCERTMRGPAMGRRYAKFGVMRSWQANAVESWANAVEQLCIIQTRRAACCDASSLSAARTGSAQMSGLERHRACTSEDRGGRTVASSIRELPTRGIIMRSAASALTASRARTSQRIAETRASERSAPHNAELSITALMRSSA